MRVRRSLARCAAEVVSVTSIRGRHLAAVVALSAVLALALTGVPTSRAGTARATDDGSGDGSVAHRAGGKKVASVVKPEPKLYRIGLDAIEPTIGLTKNGDIFMSAFQSNFRIEVVRSQNNGKTFKTVSPQFPAGGNRQLLSLDPYVYVDRATDRVFTIDLTVACSYLSYSDDHGKSWVTNPLACGRPVNDHQTLFGGRPAMSTPISYDNILYYCWNDVATSSCSKSLDGGMSFAPTGSPAYPGYFTDATDDEDENKLCGGLHGHGHVGHDGTVYLPRGYCGQPFLAISKDEGATWTRIRVSDLGASHHEASVATDKKGNIYYLWVADNRLPYLAISRNGGRKWSEPMMVAAPGVNEANLPTLAVGAVGKVAFAYMGTDNGPGQPFPEEDECTALGCAEPQKDYDKTTWNGYIAMTANALDDNPMFYSGTVNDLRDPLIRRTCGPGRCRAVFDFIDVVVAPRGDPWAAFVDGCLPPVCPSGSSNFGSDGIVGRLKGGPSLK